jgi:hypothetical protein
VAVGIYVTPVNLFNHDLSAGYSERYAKPAAGLLGLREQTVEVLGQPPRPGTLHNANFA